MGKEIFICEICGCKTPKIYEGAEPNTCEDCMPFTGGDYDY
jgi:ribosome-binding protein aMBF1 (putative translation factor)